MDDRRRRLLLIAGAAVLLLAAAIAGIWWSVRRVSRDLAKPQETAVDIGDVVTQIREMSRLETAAMHVINVSTIKQSYRFIPKSLGGDEITLYAEGDVIAGIDLSRVQQSDVTREPDGTLVMRLPDPQVLITRVDNAKTRVLNRNTGLLRGADPGLESRLRLFAEGAIRSEALRKGVLDLAAQNAEGKLAAFLHTVGFRRVRFVRSAAPRE
jgi:hypothetical protein